MALVITDADPVQYWSQILSVPHPKLLLVAAVLCLPVLEPLWRLFFPPRPRDYERGSDWLPEPGYSDDWVNTTLLMLPVFLFAVMLACYGLLVLGLYWVLAQVFG
jgi:hypothetical protein